jgi:hypothetical protein
MRASSRCFTSAGFAWASKVGRTNGRGGTLMTIAVREGLPVTELPCTDHARLGTSYSGLVPPARILAMNR